MNIIVQKYGGTSVKDTERIKNVAKRIVSRKRKGNKLVVVVSALGGVTDKLIALAQEISEIPNEREMDMLLATGEQTSVALLAMAIHELGEKAISFTGFQTGIVTDGAHTRARIKSIETKTILKHLAADEVVIVAGFQGKTESEEITTLGRGGSDLTAVALAGVLQADACEIYTDVDGVFTADPRVVPEARKIERITYDEMLELASLGAKVMQSRSIEVAKKYAIPVWVRNSMNNREGTLICGEVKEMEDVVVSGLAIRKDEVKVTIFGVPDRPGVAARVFQEIAKGDINVDMIIQNKTRTQHTDISFTVFASQLKQALKVIQKAAKVVKAEGVTVDENIAKISIVGIGMRSHTGVAAKMFTALASKRINIEMISTSEIKVSCVIQKNKANIAMNTLHQAFGLAKNEITVKKS